MDGPALEKLQSLAATEVCERCELDSDVSDVVQPETHVAALLEHLLSNERAADAVQLLAHSLEPREVVWWAWDIALANTESPGEAVTQALDSVGRWLVDPDDEKRRAAYDASEVCGLGEPAGCVAIAVFFAEGSLGPADLEQEIPSPPFSCAKAAAGAIGLSAVEVPEHAGERSAAAVSRWFELAKHDPPWVAGIGTEDESPQDDGSGYDTNLKF